MIAEEKSKYNRKNREECLKIKSPLRTKSILATASIQLYRFVPFLVTLYKSAWAIYEYTFDVHPNGKSDHIGKANYCAI